MSTFKGKNTDAGAFVLIWRSSRNLKKVSNNTLLKKVSRLSPQ